MTDPILPDDVANGLIDGTADVSSLPSELRGVAGLFAAAHQPATDAELSGMAAAMEQFSAAISGTAHPVAAVSTSGVISMFGTRVTKRAAFIVGCTLLVAGTAAAAAGGAVHVPFFSSSDSAATSTSIAVTSSSGADTSAGGSSTSIDDKGTDSTLDSALVAEDSALCTAVTASSASTSVASSNSVDDKLSQDATANGKSVDDFCAEVEAQHAAGDDVTGSSVDDHGNDTGSSVETSSGKTGTGGTGGHGGDDTATTVATGNSAAATTSSVETGSGKGTGGKTSTTLP